MLGAGSNRSLSVYWTCNLSDCENQVVLVLLLVTVNIGSLPKTVCDILIEYACETISWMARHFKMESISKILATESSSKKVWFSPLFCSSLPLQRLNSNAPTFPEQDLFPYSMSPLSVQRRNIYLHPSQNLGSQTSRFRQRFQVRDLCQPL
jgi:hypothetical protein